MRATDMLLRLSVAGVEEFLRHEKFLVAAVLIGAACDQGQPPRRPGPEEVQATQSSRSPLELRAFTKGGSRRVDSMRMARLFGDSTIFFHITSLRVLDSSLVVTDAGRNPHVVALHIGSESIAWRYGYNGEGRGELKDPQWIHRFPHEPDAFLVYDYSLRRLVVLKVSGSKVRHLQRLDVLNGPYLFQPVYLSNKLVANGYFPRHTLTVLSRAGVVEANIIAGRVPSHDSISQATLRVGLNRNRVAVDPDHKRLVLAYQAQNRLDFFDSNAAFRGSAHGPDSVRTKINVAETARGKVRFFDRYTEQAYVSVDATRDHVYALFCGRCISTGHTRTLHVFDWDGTFVREIVLDRAVYTIAVSSDGSSLFGAMRNPQSRIGEWNLAEAGWRTSRSR